eukprot:g7713.t1
MGASVSLADATFTLDVVCADGIEVDAQRQYAGVRVAAHVTYGSAQPAQLLQTKAQPPDGTGAVAWRAAGATKLQQPSAQASWLPLTGDRPLLALRVMATHLERAVVRMEGQRHGCRLVFSEAPRVGKAVLLLFDIDASAGYGGVDGGCEGEGGIGGEVGGECEGEGGCEGGGGRAGHAPAALHAKLLAVAADRPLARALVQAPAAVWRSSREWEGAATAFGAVAAAAAARGGSVKLCGSPAVRTRMLAQLGRGEAGLAGCAASGHGAVFWLLALYDGAGGYVYGSTPVAVAGVLAEAVGTGGGQVCKAVHKLDEALHSRDWLAGESGLLSLPASRRVALDIGAAPGSWSAFLHDRLCLGCGGAAGEGEGEGACVVAVDPAALAPAVLARPGIVHVRACASASDQQGMQRIKHAVAGSGRGGSGGGGGGGGGGSGTPAVAELVVCDMNRPPNECAACITALGTAGVLAHGCKVVLTLKLPRRSRQVQACLETEALDTLGAAGFGHLRLHRLFANTQFEATVTGTWQQPGAV